MAFLTTVTKIASDITSVMLSPERSSRRIAMYIYNDSAADLYLKLGTDAALDSFTVKIPPSGYFELPTLFYLGQIDGIWSEVDGNAYITEVIV